MRQAEVDAGDKPGTTRAEHAEIVRLKRELRRVEEEKLILQKAGRVFRQGDRSPVRTYRLSDQERGHHSVSLLCSVLSVSRQAYYAWTTRTPSKRDLRDRELETLIVDVYRDSRETYGAPRIAKTLRPKRGEPVATKRVARLMRRLELRGVTRGRSKRHDDPRSARRAGGRSRASPFQRAAPDQNHHLGVR